MEEIRPSSLDPLDCLVPTTVSMEGSGDGPLSGLSFVAKDLFAVEKHTSSFGHSRWRSTHDPAASTARVIRDLLDAGADLSGMAKMDQLAYSLIGDVGEGRAPLNSADPSLYCGGSSSGSASAVAGSLVDFALGTDTAGSIRVPAAVCGVFGIRPTHGSISTEGVLPLAPSFDVPGILAGDANTLAKVFSVITTQSSGRQTAHRVVMATDLFDMADRQTAQVGLEVGETIAGTTGHSLENIDTRAFSDLDVGAVFARLQGREIWEHHGDWVDDNFGVLDDDVRARLERCRSLSLDSERQPDADLEFMLEFRRQFAEVVEPGTVVVLPVVPEHGPRRTWTHQQSVEFRTGCLRLTAPAGMVGAPQVVWSTRVPLGRHIGIGLMTAPRGDHLLLDLLKDLSNDLPEIRN